MEDTTTARRATAQGSSTADLVKHLSEQIGRLARDEVRLAQLEMMRAGRRVGLGIGMFSGGGLLALYGFGCLLAAAGIAALAGRAELKKAKPPAPERAVDSVRADVEEIKESAHR
jgi:Putative Actinobacterial Holin-X, holin superfamily III